MCVRWLREECTPEQRAALSDPVMESVCETLDEWSARWKALEVGESPTVEWPL